MPKPVCIFFIFLIFLISGSTKLFSQGLNHNFLIGYDIGLFDSHVTSSKATLEIDSSSLTIVPDNFKMPFDGAQANISDENGNLLFHTNGCWIADATGDTMQNGAGLNPGSFADSYCSNILGIPYAHSSVILPYPSDSNKYILFHQVGNDDVNAMSTELYYSVVDMSLNGGLGAVIQKNSIALQDTLNQGFAACKHANGRDWWIVIFKDKTDIVYKLLLTPTGISTSSQSLGMPPHSGFNGQPQFSPDGNKFAYHYYYGFSGIGIHEIRYLNFDRCTGFFSNGNLMTFTDSVVGLGLSFSPNSRFLYFSSFNKIFQLDTYASNISSSLDTVAINDGYCFPYGFTCTDFWLMYLAADSKIYISSGSSVIDIHCISEPDSSGINCNVQQHSLRTPCYTARGNVNHPNYYLGPISGSVCDSLTHVGIQEHFNEIQNFKISPNPNNDGFVKATYLLPQNQSGIFEVYDLNGKIVFSQTLSPWSSLQHFNLSFLASGIYQCVISAGKSIATQKLLIAKK